jgi:hypothetical protein
MRPNLAVAASKAIAIDSSDLRSTFWTRVLPSFDLDGRETDEGSRVRATIRYPELASIELMSDCPIPDDVPETVINQLVSIKFLEWIALPNQTALEGSLSGARVAGEDMMDF